MPHVRCRMRDTTCDQHPIGSGSIRRHMHRAAIIRGASSPRSAAAALAIQGFSLVAHLLLASDDTDIVDRKTSGRRRSKMRLISAVHAPTPRRAIRCPLAPSPVMVSQSSLSCPLARPSTAALCAALDVPGLAIGGPDGSEIVVRVRGRHITCCDLVELIGGALGVLRRSAWSSMPVVSRVGRTSFSRSSSDDGLGYAARTAAVSMLHIRKKEPST